MITSKVNGSLVKKFIDDYPAVKYSLYAGGTVVVIWLLGKASMLMTDAVTNFKALNNAIKA